MGAGEINLTSKPHLINILTNQPQPQPQPQPDEDYCAINIPPITTYNRLPSRRTIKSKPKSRFGEPSLPIDSETMETFGFGIPKSDFEFTTPSTRSHLNSLMPKTPMAGKADSTEGPDEREVYRRVTAQLDARKNNTMSVKFSFQLVVFLIILSCLVASFTAKRMEGAVFCGLRVWKWFVLLMVIFSGMLITKWVVHLAVFCIEWKFILSKNVVYFTHGLRNTAEVFIWLSVVLGSWVLMFKPDVDQSPKNRNILDVVTWTIASMLIASFLWLIKNTLLKILASSFHLNRFFDRIQDSVFHHYVLQILSGRPAIAFTERIAAKAKTISDGAAKVTITEHVGSHKEKKVIDMAKLQKMKKDKVPSYTMQLLVDVVSNSGLSTMSGMLEEDVLEGGVELDDDEITSEEQAIATAVRIFENIVQYKDEREYIDKYDFLRFMREEEVDLLYPLFPTNDKEQICLKAFSKWVVKVLKDRQLLQHALNDNKTAVKQLNKIVIAVLIFIVFVIWLLLTQIATTQLLLFLSSQLVVAAFIFGNTCKTIFEAIIFVFVMHPFDVGDRCLVNGEMMVVEEMNILTTVFLKDDKEKVYYPNSVLATNPISNYYRSPDNQGDTLEISIDFMTSLAKIEELKGRIRKYLLENYQLWHPEHSVVMKEIENVNKIKMSLNVNHTKNFQDFEEITRRRSELVLELKQILEELDIKYRQLPQQVIVLNSTSSVTDVTHAAPKHPQGRISGFRNLRKRPVLRKRPRNVSRTGESVSLTKN